MRIAYFLCILSSVLLAAAPIRAGEYRIPLPGLLQQPADLNAEYLKSAFDFGFGFSQIESVKVRIPGVAMTPDGSTTGNSSLYRYPSITIGKMLSDQVLVDLAMLSPGQVPQQLPVRLESLLSDFMTFPLPGHFGREEVESSTFGLYNPAWDLPQLIVYSEGEVPPQVPTPENWSYFPAYLYSGRGEIGLYNVNISDYHPIVGPGVDPIFISQTSVGRHQGTTGIAELIIVGTVIPEPSTILLLLSAIFGFLVARR